MTIREIQPSDSQAVATLIRSVMTAYDCVGEGYSIHDAEVEDMYAAYNQPKAVYYVLVDKHKILGGAGIAPLQGGRPDICELRKMYYYPEARDKGLGSKMLDLLLQEARNKGYKQCYLETVDRMAAANKLYAKYGFEKLSAQQGQTGHSGCDSYYVKQL